jgi:hypothetical protein
MEESMVDVTFILDGGERISADDLKERPFDPVERVMLLAARNHIRRRLDNLSCPRHGQQPRVIASGPSPDRLTMSVEGCCHELVDDATTTLNSGGSLNDPLMVD